jgi:hypothetical protein
LEASVALAFNAVAGPVIVNPWPAVKVLRRLAPCKVVLVRSTETLVTPSAEFALNENVAEGWNRCEPSGDMLENVGWACAAATMPSPASTDRERTNEVRGSFFM